MCFLLLLLLLCSMFHVCDVYIGLPFLWCFIAVVMRFFFHSLVVVVAITIVFV